MCQSFIALLSFAAAVASAQTTFAAAPGWAGQYRNDKFLNGKAVFQLSIEQSGNAIQVSFDAVCHDAHGAAPEGQGPARVTGKDSLQFKWEDSFQIRERGQSSESGTPSFCR